LFTALTVALLPALFHLGEKKGTPVAVYAMPKGLLVFMWCAVAASMSALLVPAYLGTKPKVSDWWSWGGLSTVFAAGAAYMRRYTVRLTDGALEMTEFRTERIAYASIHSVEVVTTGKGSHLVVFFNGSERLVISDYISHFEELAAQLKARVARAKQLKSQGEVAPV
jgi:hypothetical protein